MLIFIEWTAWYEIGTQLLYLPDNLNHMVLNLAQHFFLNDRFSARSICKRKVFIENIPILYSIVNSPLHYFALKRRQQELISTQRSNVKERELITLP